MAVSGGKQFTIHTPLIHQTKAQIIRRGMDLGVDYGMTHSCYDSDAQGRACGRSDSCLLRKNGFAEAGVADPTRYITP
jgi:7-cyano-7-deazaguanine synthase